MYICLQTIKRGRRYALVKAKALFRNLKKMGTLGVYVATTTEEREMRVERFSFC